MSKGTYDRLKAYCDKHGVSKSGMVEAQVNSFLDALPSDLSSVVKMKEKPVRVVAPKVPEVREATPPNRIDRIREVADTKKPVVPPEKIFTF